jgi:hypothetical protein
MRRHRVWPRARGRTRSRFDRALAVTLVSGLGLLLILGLVFSIAQGSQQITTRATDLHNADETLRAATVVRAQVGLAAHLTRIDDVFGTNSTEAIELSLSEAKSAFAWNDPLPLAGAAFWRWTRGRTKRPSLSPDIDARLVPSSVPSSPPSNAASIIQGRNTGNDLTLW